MGVSNSSSNAAELCRLIYCVTKLFSGIGKIANFPRERFQGRNQQKRKKNEIIEGNEAGKKERKNNFPFDFVIFIVFIYHCLRECHARSCKADLHISPSR